MKRFSFRKIAGIILLVIAGIFIFGNIVMFLWNALMPVIFHLPLITFWQALGLLLLSKILFGGFRGRGGPGRMWKRNMQEKWMNMSPEEKEKFKQDWRNRCKNRPFGERGRTPFEQWDRFPEDRGQQTKEEKSQQGEEKNAQ